MGPVHPLVWTLGELRDVLHGVADAHRALTHALPAGVTAPFFAALRNRLAETVRGGLISYPWFAGLAALLQATFGGGPNAGTVSRFIAWIGRSRCLSVAEAEGVSVTEALLWAGEASGELRPRWDAQRRTLTVGGWAKQYKRQAGNQFALLAAFEKAGWPDCIGPPSGAGVLNVTVRDLNDSLGDGARYLHDERIGRRGAMGTCPAELSELHDPLA